jgi:hypothetical protein
VQERSIFFLASSFTFISKSVSLPATRPLDPSPA